MSDDQQQTVNALTDSDTTNTSECELECKVNQLLEFIKLKSSHYDKLRTDPILKFIVRNEDILN